MKKQHFITTAIVIAALTLVTYAADTRDVMVGKVTGNGPSSLNPPLATAAHALVSKDHSIALSAYGGVLTVEGSRLNSHQTVLAFDEPTADRTITFSNATGRVETTNVIAKAATGTISVSECYGGIITNTGASGAIVLTLPAPVVGMHLRVCLTVSQDVNVDTPAGTQILGLTNGVADAISSASAAGNAVELLAVSATQWVTLATSGSWADVN